jgi:hypothetical protein
LPELAFANSGFFLQKHFQERTAELQIPPLRYASVGMTKWRVALLLRPVDRRMNADPSASLGMTKGRAALPFEIVSEQQGAVGFGLGFFFF